MIGMPALRTLSRDVTMSFHGTAAWLEDLEQTQTRKVTTILSKRLVCTTTAASSQNSSTSRWLAALISSFDL